MVDGMPRPGTVLSLSHWAGTPTPEDLWDDVSAGIVLRALAKPGTVPAGVEAASIDHYDEDGVLSLGLLCLAGLAEAHGALVVEAAHVGDFGVVRHRRAALVAFALAGVARAGEPEVADVMARCARHATDALAILPALVEEPERFEDLWGDEASAYDASRRALDEGQATVEERPEHDLAVVRVDGAPGALRGCGWEGAALHRAAVHSATSCLRVFTVVGRRYELRYRYESWVRLVSRRPRPRVDLGALAATLTAAEPTGARWAFDGAAAITGALHLVGEADSGLEPDRVLDEVCRCLEQLDAGPPAWDPYAAPVRRV
jgi:hypothetical protein